REEPCLPSQGDGTQRPLRRIVAETDAAVVEEAGERGPALQHVIHGLRDIAMARESGALSAHPAFEVADQRCDIALAPCQTLVRMHAVDVALQSEDRVDPLH